MQQVNSINNIKTLIKENGDIVVNKNITSKKDYKKTLFSNEAERHLLNSEKDIENGKTKKASVVFKELEEEYGF